MLLLLMPPLYAMPLPRVFALFRLLRAMPASAISSLRRRAFDEDFSPLPLPLLAAAIAFRAGFFTAPRADALLRRRLMLPPVE